jgi:LL-diaminopimelate aminotransferase
VAHLEKRPDANIIPLGIGDTTEPLTETVAKAMADAALGMGTREGYSGCTLPPLRPSFIELRAY